MSSKITPAGYGTVYRTWSGTDLVSDAYTAASRNVFGGSITVYSVSVKNDSGNLAYVKLYANRVEFAQGSTTTLRDPVMVLPITNSGYYTVTIPEGYTFANGLTVRATAGAANADTTDPGTTSTGVSIQVVGK